MPSPPFALDDVATLGRKLRDRSVTAVELTRGFLDRLQSLGPQLNAVVTLRADAALLDAAEADRRVAAGELRGPLDGIPFGVKDLLATADLPTSWGARPLADQQFDRDGEVVKRLKAAGAVLVAKLALVELAGGMGYSQPDASFTGPGKNPWNPNRWAGGSSNGSATAVSAGLVPFSIGSETWGSIVTPASYCGVTGLRPTYGRVSRSGAMALSWTMDKLGPLARTAADCRTILEVISGYDANDPSSLNVPPLGSEPLLAPPYRIAVLPDAADNVQDGIRTNYERAIDLLSRKAEIIEVELPKHPYNMLAGLIIDAELPAVFRDLIRSGQVWQLTAPEDRVGGYAPEMISSADYLTARRLRFRAQKELDAFFRGFDALLTPATSTTAPPLGRDFQKSFAGFRSPPVSGAANLAGLPGITLPSGFDAGGLPTGIVLTSRALDEHRLLSIAETYQSLTKHHEATPDV